MKLARRGSKAQKEPESLFGGTKRHVRSVSESEGVAIVLGVPSSMRSIGS